MTYVPVLYSDKELPLHICITAPDGSTVVFPDESPCEFEDLSKHYLKEAVEEEIRVIRPILPEYSYYLPMPWFTTVQGELRKDSAREIKQMRYIDRFLIEVIHRFGAELVFLNVCVGDDYECIDDVNFVKINLNKNEDDLIKGYVNLFHPDNIVEFVIEDDKSSTSHP